jgi:hypothetical protein
MRTGILTFHAGFNHGAYLQAFALQKVLDEQKIDNLIIDYQGSTQIYHEYREALIKKDIWKIFSRLGRIIQFQRAHRYLNKTRKITKINTDILAGFETLVIGSDEIWNLGNSVFGYDSAYLGKGFVGTKISYAASFGSTPINIVLPPHMKKSLRELKSISVRDLNSFAIIKRNLGIEPAIVPDPTIVYDVLSHASPCKHRDYILVYATDLSKDIIGHVKKYANRTRKNIISIGYKNNWADQNITNLMPFELLGYYQNADFVVTNLFHGTIFSILAEKQFMLQLSPYRINKFSPMLELLGLKNRVYTPSNEADIFNHAIDYVIVRDQLKKYRLVGLEYIGKHLTNYKRSQESP